MREGSSRPGMAIYVEAVKMKQGTISSYNPKRFLGTIVVPGDIPERYFFFGNCVIAGPAPVVGATALFEVSTRRVEPGKLPIAHTIEILSNDKTETVAEGFVGKVGA